MPLLEHNLVHFGSNFFTIIYPGRARPFYLVSEMFDIYSMMRKTTNQYCFVKGNRRRIDLSEAIDHSKANSPQ